MIPCVGYGMEHTSLILKMEENLLVVIIRVLVMLTCSVPEFMRLCMR